MVVRPSVLYLRFVSIHDCAISLERELVMSFSKIMFARGLSNFFKSATWLRKNFVPTVFQRFPHTIFQIFSLFHDFFLARLREIQDLLVVDDELADRLGEDAIGRRIDRNQVPSRDDLREAKQHIAELRAELIKRQVLNIGQKMSNKCVLIRHKML